MYLQNNKKQEQYTDNDFVIFTVKLAEQNSLQKEKLNSNIFHVAFLFLLGNKDLLGLSPNLAFDIKRI